MGLGPASLTRGGDFFVNLGGENGEFPTVQSAIDAVEGQTATDRANIFIAPGRYVEQVVVDKPFITLIGLGSAAEQVVISFNSRPIPDVSLNEATSITGNATAFMAQNLTFENSTPDSSASQAVALGCHADRAIFDNVRFLGYQDTLFAWSMARQYFRKSFITGDTDFIFGNATAVFDRCTIESTDRGYITAADTTRTTANGLIFLDCQLVKGISRHDGTTAPNNSVFLGRPWFYTPSELMPSVVYIRTRMGPHIAPAGWDPWNSLLNPSINRDPFTRVSEWGSMSLTGQLLLDSNQDGTPDGRVGWADSMTAAQAANYTVQNIFGPVDFWNATTQPDSLAPYVSQGDPWNPELQLLWLPAKPGAKPQFFNISTRLRIDAAHNVGIGGFIITGTAPKKVIVRAIGPSLRAAGLQEVLGDPVLALHGEGDEPIAVNNNWQEDASAAELIAKGLSPAHELESALVLTLAPGHYTAVIRGNDPSLGTALVEVYDGDLPADSQLANISTLGFVGVGDDVLIAGVVIGGPAAATVVLRAVGPSLTEFGVSNALQDPTLQLYDANGSLTSNDDWETPGNGEPVPVSLQPRHPRESALQISLVPGFYTAIVRGKEATTGVALVEAYKLE
jgi:pectin methylesterase-like acyl-CoA thioesterase